MSRGINSDSARQDNQAENFSSWGGQGTYNPFPGPQGSTTYLSVDDGKFSGGSGGGGYVAPVPPNPTYVPPSFFGNGIIKISLSTSEPVSFLEDDTILSYGQTAVKSYGRQSFGQTKIYKVTTNGKTAKNYYEVSIQKKHRTVKNIREVADEDDRGGNISRPEDIRNQRNESIKNTNNFQLKFGGNNDNALQTRFSEVVLVKEYELDVNNVYKLKGEKSYDLRRRTGLGLWTGYQTVVLNLDFSFKPKDDVRVDLPPTKKTACKINFDSNYASDLGNKVALSYDLVDKDGFLIKQGKTNLDFGGNDPTEEFSSDLLNNSIFKFRVDGNIPGNYTINGIYYTNRPVNVDKFE